MKYIFFDCFSGFTPAMAAGAIADMTKDVETLKRVAGSISEITFNICEEKRSSMEACLVAVSAINNEFVGKDELCDMANKLSVSPETKGVLESYIAKKSDARAINPQDAQFSLKKELEDLICAAYVVEKAKSLKAEKIYVSHVGYSDATLFSGTEFVPATRAETMYICKKHGIELRALPVEEELINESGAALLASLGATCASAPGGSIIKTGYGAGEHDLKEIPNILRVVLGEENSDSLFEAGVAFEDMFTEFSAALTER